MLVDSMDFCLTNSTGGSGNHCSEGFPRDIRVINQGLLPSHQRTLNLTLQQQKDHVPLKTVPLSGSMFIGRVLLPLTSTCLRLRCGLLLARLWFATKHLTCPKDLEMYICILYTYIHIYIYIYMCVRRVYTYIYIYYSIYIYIHIICAHTGSPTMGTVYLQPSFKSPRTLTSSQSRPLLAPKPNFQKLDDITLSLSVQLIYIYIYIYIYIKTFVSPAYGPLMSTTNHSISSPKLYSFSSSIC